VFTRFVLFWCMLLLIRSAIAADEVQYSLAPFLSVAESIAAMDTDHDGIVTVHEVRVFLESKHGKGYEQKVFDAMEKSAENRSCGSSFTKSLY
jgi:hypothetical protein